MDHVDIIEDAIRTSFLIPETVTVSVQDHEEGIMVVVTGEVGADLISAVETISLEDAGSGYVFHDSGPNGSPEGGYWSIWVPR